jgi:hypothetical protein
MRLGFSSILSNTSLGENKLVRAKCANCPLRLQNGCKVNISKVVFGFRNFGYEFLSVGGDVWRWLCRHYAVKFQLMTRGGWAEGLACADRERGPQSAWTEFTRNWCIQLVTFHWLYYHTSIHLLVVMPVGIIISRHPKFMYRKNVFKINIRHICNQKNAELYWEFMYSAQLIYHLQRW